LPASEDFSYLLQQYPGAMLFLGAAPSVPSGPMHSARMILNEEALAVGAAMLSTIALAQPLD
jgi:metal-dependent amidase/aminoacylase/carboxypeptidase family protein